MWISGDPIFGLFVRGRSTPTEKYPKALWVPVICTQNPKRFGIFLGYLAEMYAKGPQSVRGRSALICQIQSAYSLFAHVIREQRERRLCYPYPLFEYIDQNLRPH